MSNYRKRVRAEALAKIDAYTEEEKAKRDTAYFVALQDERFKKLDMEIRELTLKIGNPKTLKKDTKQLQTQLQELSVKRDKIFAKYYKKPSEINIEKFIQEKIFEKSGLSTHVPKTFLNSAPFGLEKSYDALEKYAAKFPNSPKQNIVVSGSTGTGKTWAVQILGKQLIDRGVGVLYVTAFDMVNRIRSYVFDKDAEAFDDMIECDVLIIDDIGTEPAIKNITDEYLYNLVNARLVAGRSIIITTNLDKEMLRERYNDRIISRMFNKATTAEIHFAGKDLRQGL